MATSDLLQQEDLLTCDRGEGVDVITDKGTLDAIGLSANPHGRWSCEPCGHADLAPCSSKCF